MVHVCCYDAYRMGTYFIYSGLMEGNQIFLQESNEQIFGVQVINLPEEGTVILICLQFPKNVSISMELSLYFILHGKFCFDVW